MELPGDRSRCRRLTRGVTITISSSIIGENADKGFKFAQYCYPACSSLLMRFLELGCYLWEAAAIRTLFEEETYAS
jgi:hypothetical protein